MWFLRGSLLHKKEKKKKKRINYHFGPGLCVEIVFNFSTVSNWPLTFRSCVKMVLAVKSWMKNID